MEEKIDEIVHLLDVDDNELYYDIKHIIDKMSNYWIPGINTIEDFSLYLDLYFDKKLSKFVFKDLDVFELSSNTRKVIIKKLFDLINKLPMAFGIIMLDKETRDCTIYNSLNELQVAVSTTLKFKSKKTMFYIIDNQYYSIDTPIYNSCQSLPIKEEIQEEEIQEEIKKELKITLLKTFTIYSDCIPHEYKDYTIHTWTIDRQYKLDPSSKRDIIWFINMNDINRLVNEFDKIKFRHRVKLAVFVGNTNDYIKVRHKLNHIPFKIMFQNTDNIDQELILDEYIKVKNTQEETPEIKKELRFTELSSKMNLKRMPVKYNNYNIDSHQVYTEHDFIINISKDIIWYINMDHMSRLLNNINDIKFLHRVKLAVFVGKSDEIFTFNQMRHMINTPFKILDQPIDNIDQDLILDEYIKIKSTQK